MEEDDSTLIYPLLAIGDKRPIINEDDDSHREAKRQCKQPFGFNHDDGSAKFSSYMLSPGEAQDGFYSGSGNTLYQPNVNTALTGYLESEYSSGLPLISDLPDFGPGYPAYETLTGFIPFQSIGVKTYTPEFGNSFESFTDESPFSIVTQTDSNLNIGYLSNSISRGEFSVIEEPIITAVEQKHASEVSNGTNLWDGYASIPLQRAGDCPSNLEMEVIASQEIGEPMSQSSGIVSSGPIGPIIRNEKTYQG